MAEYRITPLYRTRDGFVARDAAAVSVIAAAAVILQASGEAAVSPAPGNRLERRTDGLFVGPPQLSSENW